MAVVFQAVDERLQRPVALKIMAPELAADEAFRRRFIRESRAAAAVDSPHIIPVFEAGGGGGGLYFSGGHGGGGGVGSPGIRVWPLPPPGRSQMSSRGALAPVP